MLTVNGERSRCCSGCDVVDKRGILKKGVGPARKFKPRSARPSVVSQSSVDVRFDLM
jgi:hypothetical protein